MTIDEAIAHAREVASEQRRRSGTCTTNDNECDKFSNCMKCAEEHEQIAEWLEELKVYQQHEIICNKGYNAGYNKAIDDFVAYANTMPTVEDEYDGYIRPMHIEEMAEQLKRGGTE